MGHVAQLGKSCHAGHPGPELQHSANRCTGRQRPEGQHFEVILGYIVNSRGSLKKTKQKQPPSHVGVKVLQDLKIIFFFYFILFGFLKHSFSVALEPVLEQAGLVNQAGLELTELLSLPLDCWD